MIVCTKYVLRMYLNLSIRVREVKEVSKSDRQLKKVEHKINDLKLDIMKFSEHNLQFRRWYGVYNLISIQLIQPCTLLLHIN